MENEDLSHLSHFSSKKKRRQTDSVISCKVIFFIHFIKLLMKKIRLSRRVYFCFIFLLLDLPKFLSMNRK